MKLSQRLLFSLAALAPISFVTACGSADLEPQILPQAYGVVIPNPESVDGEILFSGPIDTPAMQTMVTTQHNVVIGYADYDYEKLAQWLDENKPSVASVGMHERDFSSDHREISIGGTTYFSDYARCFSSPRDSNFFTDKTVNITPFWTDEDVQHKVMLDVTASTNSLGCLDDEYYAVVQPGLMQRGQTNQTSPSLGDIAGEFIDGWLNG